jgi:hypothetical protein
MPANKPRLRAKFLKKSIKASFGEEHFCLTSVHLATGVIPMNERQTLSLLGWTVGTVVAVVFILNGIALSLP